MITQSISLFTVRYALMAYSLYEFLGYRVAAFPGNGFPKKIKRPS